MNYKVRLSFAVRSAGESDPQLYIEASGASVSWRAMRVREKAGAGAAALLVGWCSGIYEFNGVGGG